MIAHIVDEYSSCEKYEVIHKIRDKLALLSNNNLLDIRLHRICHKDNWSRFLFDTKLSTAVYDNRVVLFNCDRFPEAPSFNIIDQEILLDTPSIPSEDEVMLFLENQPYLFI